MAQATDSGATGLVRMHPDFAHLQVRPGEVTLDPGATEAQFGVVNLLAFGGAAEKGAHMPAIVGQVDEVVLWESTGASDALPFWNTNYSCDVHLLLMEGEVRVEFKEPESDTHLGTYISRTGDLMKLPRAVAHRTFSTSGKRRISLEIVKRNPYWDHLGEHAGVAALTEPRLGGLRFTVEGDAMVVEAPGAQVRTPLDFFLRGIRILIAYELHLEHNEFEGGFVVHDRGSEVDLKVGTHTETFAPAEVMALFRCLAGRS